MKRIWMNQEGFWLKYNLTDDICTYVRELNSASTDIPDSVISRLTAQGKIINRPFYVHEKRELILDLQRNGERSAPPPPPTIREDTTT